MATTVVPLVQEWNLSFNTEGGSGTKKFIDSSSVVSPVTTQDLPIIGETWSGEYPTLTVDSIDTVYVGDSDNCGKFYTVNYNTESALRADAANPPISLEMSAEFTTLTDSKDDNAGHFVWPDNERVADLKVRAREVNTVAVVHRYMEFTEISDWLDVSMERVGKINTDIFLGVASGGALYLGCNASELNASSDSVRRWDLQLKFSIKKVDDSFENAWNKLLRPGTFQYEIPTFQPGGNNLYEGTNFAPLLSAGPATPISF